MFVEFGPLFREAWIAGVRRHHPGEPEPGDFTPWTDLSAAEKDSAIAIHRQVHDFVLAGGGATARLSREQKGRFVALCRIVQNLKHHNDPTPDQLADGDDVPAWQRETDADVFERIENSALGRR